MIYKCSVCGYVYDEEKEGKPFSELIKCPICQQPPERFEAAETPKNPVLSVEPGKKPAPVNEDGLDLDYPSETRKMDSDYRYMREIHEMAVTGKSAIEAMGTRMKMPDWDDVLILGAQLNPMPLDEHADVSLETVIGKHAKKPMVLDMPVYISHMSFGALSRETKIALAKGSAAAGTAMCSGEGGILPEEKSAAYKYIFEYVPNLYSVTDENLLLRSKSDRVQNRGWAGICPAAR